MKIVELQDRSLASLLQLIEKQTGQYRNLFRGQCRAEWELTPSLYRRKNRFILGENMERGYDFHESSWISRFFDDALPYLPAISRSYSNDRILAQHFGVPTRLLDWTTDPLVAAFFAVEDAQSKEDGALYMILPEAKHRPEEVKSLGPNQVIALVPPAIDMRVVAQKSVFTFHPYGPSDEPFVPLDQRPDIGGQIQNDGIITRGFTKIIIPARAKPRLRGTLLRMGYDRAHLFPGLDGVGANIGARARAGGSGS